MPSKEKRRRKGMCRREQIERAKRRNVQTVAVLTMLFIVLAFIFHGEVSHFFSKSAELLAAAGVYWHFFGCLE